MRKIVITKEMPEYMDELKKRLPDWKIVHGASPGECLDQMADAEIAIGWGGIEKAVFVSDGSLKWIQCLSAGVDAFPFDLLKEKGIMVTTASGVHANSISETVLGIMLSFSRQLFNIHIDQLNKIWNHAYSDCGKLTEIHGKAIGIIGAGAVGLELARLAKAFNMRTLGYRRSGMDAHNIDKMYGPDGLNELLAQSDYIVNILPATPQTDKLIGDAQFGVMKSSAVYISVGRGQTTDTDAIIRAMQSGKIAGAGLDVVDPEPLPKDSPLWGMKNVYIGAHNAGGTDKYNERAMEIFFANLEDYLAGRPLSLNLVDLDLQY